MALRFHPNRSSPVALSLESMDTYLEFAGNHPLLLIALLASFFVVVFTELRRQAAGLVNIEPPEVVKLINAEAAIIDLRTAEAYTRGHIVHAKNVAFDELQSDADKIEALKTKPVIAVCETGVTSTKAVHFLRKQGVERVYGLKGGMSAWAQASLPVVTARKKNKR